MTKVISISTDRNIFKENSAVQARQIEYGALFDELHIVVFTKLTSFLPSKIQIAPNVWAYGTHSLSKLLHISQAVKIAERIIAENKKSGEFTPESSVITVQDPFETGLVGSKLKKKFGLPLHIQIHTDFLNPYFAKQSLLNKFRVKMAKKLLPQADAIRVVSRRIADNLSELSGISLNPGAATETLKPKAVPESQTSRIVSPTILPIFVDIKKIKDAPVTVDLKNKYPQFNFIILMASRLTNEKNISFAIKVFEKLVSVYPKIGLVVAGSGPEGKKLVSLAKRLKIAKNVIFEPWQDNLSSYYKTANLFLLTSNYEGYGLTLVEAVASRCPVVSTDVGAASELLRDEKNREVSGVPSVSSISSVCPVGDTACFFNKISAFIENPGIREHSIHEAYARLGKVVIFDKSEYLKKYQKS
ncbi:MAG: glycosyltransferase, partial [Patescibacteria group bacterium]